MRAVSVAVIAWMIAIATFAPPVRAQTETRGSKTQQVVDLINHARVQAGLLPVAPSAELTAAAQAHSQDMVDHDYLDHTGSDGSEPQERADRAGYHVPPSSGWIVVEVISAISADPSGPVDWWMGDDQHHNVLLNPRWREIGVGYAQGGEFGNYWTADFGCRPGVLPSVQFEGRTYTPTEECGDPNAAVAVVPSATAVPTAPPTPVPTLAPASQATPVPTSPPSPVPTLTPPRVAVQSRGSSATVSWSNIQGATSRDWFGIYTPGAGDAAWRDWDYVSCDKTPGQASTSGSCQVTLTPGGSFEVRLFRDDGYTVLARSGPFSLQPPAALQMSPSTAQAGGVVNVQWQNVEAPAATDWIGLYRSGDPDMAQLSWVYVGCSQQPLDARALGSCNVQLPRDLAPGTYEFRLFVGNSYTRMSVSQPFGVS